MGAKENVAAFEQLREAQQARDWDAYQTFLTKELTALANVAHVKTALTIRSSKSEPGVPVDMPAEQDAAIAIQKTDAAPAARIAPSIRGARSPPAIRPRAWSFRQGARNEVLGHA